MPQLSICQPMHGKCVLKYTSVRRTTMQIIDARSYVNPKDLYYFNQNFWSLCKVKTETTLLVEYI